MSDERSPQQAESGKKKAPDAKKDKRLAEGMDRMLERTRAYKKEGGRGTTLRDALEQARERAVDLGELTRDEARMLAEFLWRDLEDAGGFLARTGRSLRDWLYFDMELLEREFLERFLTVADQTRVEWLEFERQSKQPPVYRTGEMTTAGTLECLACGQQMRFKRPGHIPPCPHCGGTEFQRRAQSGRSKRSDEAR